MVWRAALVLTTVFAIAGCARDPTEGIRYLGLSDVQAHEADEDDTSDGLSPAVRHVQSNKVLGAMAYQKVTGRAVDPSRLTGAR